jgi:hypothetical protein
VECMPAAASSFMLRSCTSSASFLSSAVMPCSGAAQQLKGLFDGHIDNSRPCTHPGTVGMVRLLPG